MSLLAVTFFSTIFFAGLAFSAERKFQIHSTKQVTPNVERFYGKDGSAFATLFCQGDTAQVMIVDSRLTDLDGKNFFFESLTKCLEGRKTARELHKKCTVSLEINQAQTSALIHAAGCNSNSGLQHSK